MERGVRGLDGTIEASDFDRNSCKIWLSSEFLWGTEGPPYLLTQQPQRFWRLRSQPPSDDRRKCPEFILNCIDMIVPYPKGVTCNCAGRPTILAQKVSKLRLFNTVFSQTRHWLAVVSSPLASIGQSLLNFWRKRRILPNFRQTSQEWKVVWRCSFHHWTARLADFTITSISTPSMLLCTVKHLLRYFVFFYE